VPLPQPRRGLVISYAYLWADEYEAGREEGVKDRPCAIVLAAESSAGQIVVSVVPITHSEPSNPDFSIEIPQPTKQRLGLDSERSWIVADETNHFVWPGSDLRPVSRSEPDRFDYGLLPPALYKKVVEMLIKAARHQRLSPVPRS